MANTIGRAPSSREREELAGERIVIEAVSPTINGGLSAAKAVAGGPMIVEADTFGDGHEQIAAAVKMPDSKIVPMTRGPNDPWHAEVNFTENGPA